MARSAMSSLINVVEYYLIVVLSSVLLFRHWPALREAISLARLRSFLGPGATARELFGAPADTLAFRVFGGREPFSDPWMDPVGGAVPASVAMLGALALVIPVAWIYTITKQGQRYDSSVLQSVIIMPIAVAGIVIIVQNSIALAFSLAGIVAAVRWRTTLKDTKDAVYIFVAIGVGLAAGVQALLVALVMSLSFNVVVLALWRFNVGEIYAYKPAGAAGSTPALAPGDAPLKQPKPFNGLLRIHTPDVTAARTLVEQILEAEVKRWQPAGSFGEGGAGTLQYLVRLKKRTPAGALVDLINETGATHEVVAEFEPFEE